MMLSYAKYRLILPVLERMTRRLLDYDLRELRTAKNKDAKYGADDRRQLQELQTLVDLLIENPRYAWLYKNRIERMDATLPFFDEGRRNFHLARYQFAVDYVQGRDVVDVACGTGYGAELLMVKGRARSVTGIDIDSEAIDYAQAVHGVEGARFVCASGDATPLPDESVDLVTSFETIEHVPDAEALLGEVRRILRPGGTFVCSTPNDWPLEEAPFHVRVYNRESFETVIGKFFVDLQTFNQNSGCKSRFNHDQPAGIVPTTDENHTLAECFITVCRKST